MLVFFVAACSITDTQIQNKKILEDKTISVEQVSGDIQIKSSDNIEKKKLKSQKEDHHIPHFEKVEKDFSHTHRSKEDSLFYVQPYPFTANELLEKLDEIIKLPAKQITRDKIQNIFSIKLPLYTLGEKEPTSSYQWVSNRKDSRAIRYLARQGHEWYFNVQLDEYQDGQVNFMLDWGNDDIYSPKILANDLCLNVGELRNRLQTHGWKYLDESMPARPGAGADSTYYSQKKNAILRLTSNQNSNCLAEISIYSDFNNMHDNSFNVPHQR